MAEIRLPIVANLNLDEQQVVNLGAQTLGPDGIAEATRRDYTDTSVEPVATVGSTTALGPDVVNNVVNAEVDANYLKVVKPKL